MKLSEAMRLGSMMKPQAFGTESVSVEYPPVPGDVLGLRHYEGTCAFGAALDAHPCSMELREVKEGTRLLRGGYAEAGTSAWFQVYPQSWLRLFYFEVDCPQCGLEDQSVFSLIPHLNDSHRWTRRQIADWIEAQEQFLEHAAASLQNQEIGQAQ